MNQTIGCRAQTSVEFILILSIAFSVFLLVLSVVDDRNTDALRRRSILLARATLESFSADVNRVAISGSGTRKTHELIEGKSDIGNYTIVITPHARIAEIRWQYKNQNKFYSVPLITSNISGNLSLKPGRITLSNNNGGVQIS